MEIKKRTHNGKLILLGIEDSKFLTYPDVYWQRKNDFEELKFIPNYLKDDEVLANRKVVEIFKRKYDLDFHTGRVHGNESLTPLYFQQKRKRLALESIGYGSFYQAKENIYSDDFLFSMLVGKFETLNEIIDSQIQESEAHSRFEWCRTRSKLDLGQKISDEEIEKGLIELCQFVSQKVISGKYSSYLFIDIYALWKAFLLGNLYSKNGEIRMKDSCPKFVCTIKSGEWYYHFNYEFFAW